MKYILPVMFLLSLTSCVTQKRCEEKFGPQTVSVKDSIVIRDSIVVKTKDSISFTSKDSVVVVLASSGSDSIPCNETVEKTIVRGGDTFTIKVKGGKVYFDYNLAGTISRYLKTGYYAAHEHDSINVSSAVKSNEVVKEKPAPVKGFWQRTWAQIRGWIEFLLMAIGILTIVKYVVRLVIKRVT